MNSEQGDMEAQSTAKHSGQGKAMGVDWRKMFTHLGKIWFWSSSKSDRVQFQKQNHEKQEP